MHRTRSKPRYRQGERFVATALAAFALCFSAVPSAPAKPGNLSFHGNLTLNGKPAPGEEIVVVAGPVTWALTVCARTRSDAGGKYYLTIESRAGCVDEGRKAVPFIFTWHGQQIGEVTEHHDGFWGKATLITQHLNIFVPLALYTLEDVPRPKEPVLVAHRYYGQLLVHGKPPAGTAAVTVVTDNGYPCGRGTADEKGRFLIDISTEAGCGSSRGGPAVGLSFRIDGREVWKTRIALIHDLPTTLGKPSATPTLAADWRGR